MGTMRSGQMFGVNDMRCVEMPVPELRDGEMLKGVLPETTRHFGRAIIMPNLVPPVVTGADAAGYRDRILAANCLGWNCAWM